MATELDQTYCGWPHQELLGQEDSQDVVIAQMLEQGSISFGRYTVESLAWEKRSVFTHNRCQEELEKLRAPGLVAQKKAYFEAHYKRIRTLKALQASEQTELFEDYGGDDCSSCKNGEFEDENFEHEPLINGATNVSAGCWEEHVAEAAFGMESSGALCCGCSDPKYVGPCRDFSKGTIKSDSNPMNAHLNDDMTREPTDSSTTSFKEIDMDNNSTDSLQCGHLDPEVSISYDDLWGTDVEDAMLKENCSDALQVGHMPKESTVLDSPRRIEEIELLKGLCSDDDEWNVKEARDTEFSNDSGTRAEVRGADAPVLKSFYELLPVDNHISREAKDQLNKQNSHSLAPRIKESITSVRKTKKTECRTKSETTKASQQTKYLLQKTIVLKKKKKASESIVPSCGLSNKNKSTSDISYRPQKVHSKIMETGGKEGYSTNLSNAKCNKFPRKNNSALVSSNKPLKGSSSLGNKISRPLSFATQRQPTAPCGIRDIGPQNSYSKSLNGSIHVSKQLLMQSTSVKRHAANSTKAAGLEKKSHHGEIPKTGSILNSHSAVPRARDGVPQRPGTRSIILPAVNKYSLTNRAGCELKGERPKEKQITMGDWMVKPMKLILLGKTNARPRLFEGTSKIAAAPLARTNKTNLRKQVSTQTGSLLLDGKKSRQEVKPWR